MSLPESGLKPIKTWADARLALHSVTLAVVPLLVVLFGVNGSAVLGWVALVFAAVDAITSFTNTYDGVRKFIYVVGGIAQSALLAVGVAADNELSLKVGAVITFATALVAVFYTPNSVVVVE